MTLLILALDRQKQVNLSEFEAILVYKSFMIGRTITQRNPVSKKKKTIVAKIHIKEK